MAGLIDGQKRKKKKSKNIADIDQGDIDYLSRQQLLTIRFNINDRYFHQAVRRLNVKGISNLGEVMTARFEEHEYIFRIARDRVVKLFPPAWINILTNKIDILVLTSKNVNSWITILHMLILIISEAIQCA